LSLEPRDAKLGERESELGARVNRWRRCQSGCGGRGKRMLKGNGDGRGEAQPAPTLCPRPPLAAPEPCRPSACARGAGLTVCRAEALGLCQRGGGRGPRQPMAGEGESAAKRLCLSRRWSSLRGRHTAPRCQRIRAPSFGNEMCAMPALPSVLTLSLPLYYLWPQAPGEPSPRRKLQTHISTLLRELRPGHTRTCRRLLFIRPCRLASYP
jgi:hypothetical protein